MDNKKRLFWFIFIRVVVVSLFLISAIIFNLNEPENFPYATLSGLIRLLAATYLFSFASLIALKLYDTASSALAYIQIIWDLLFVTLLILLTGGINSPYSFLYILSITSASVLLARREAFYTASLCGILYGAILDFQYYGKLNQLGLGQLSAQQPGANYVFYTIFVNILAYYLTALLTGYLAERAKRSETALRKKVIDYEELERLNSAIVFNLDSGLLTVNSEGKIRVFNRYIAKLTGMTQEDAYDRKLSEILPAFHDLCLDSNTVQKGEIEHRSTTGNPIILAFKTAPLFQTDSRRTGVLIDLQDLTRLKKMEFELKKADRLAALGELSARIAHEIRNPLASISGSVQLIAQAETIDHKDRKLMEIVLRETDRLNQLICDYLSYARPMHPLKVRILLRKFISDLISLVRSDPRFDKLTFSVNCPDDMILYLDRDQCQQVFWNLMVNAAEAMPKGGTIRFDAEILTSAQTGVNLGEMAQIVVSDNGKGMASEEVKRVFEPFFTTKPTGTGLGLATVYRIIESHGGAITVESSAGKGTAFSIYLPVTTL